MKKELPVLGIEAHDIGWQHIDGEIRRELRNVFAVMLRKAVPVIACHEVSTRTSATTPRRQCKAFPIDKTRHRSRARVPAFNVSRITLTTRLATTCISGPRIRVGSVANMSSPAGRSSSDPARKTVKEWENARV